MATLKLFRPTRRLLGKVVTRLTIVGGSWEPQRIQRQLRRVKRGQFGQHQIDQSDPRALLGRDV